MGDGTGDVTFDPPRLTWVRYDDGGLRASWVAGSTVPSATYELWLYDSGVVAVVFDAGQDTIAALPVDLPPGGEYAVQVVLYVGASVKGRSPQVGVVVDTVPIERADTDPVTGAVTLSWTAGASDEFLYRLAVNGAPPGPEYGATGPDVLLTPPPEYGALVAASLACVTTDGDTVVVGPYGPGFPVPTTRPDVLSVGYDDSTLSVTWTGVPAASGYVVSVLQGAAVVASAPVAAPLTTAQLAFAAGDGIAYAVVVQATTAAGSGPPSAPVPVLVTAAPELTSAAYDGSTLAVAWDPVAGDAVTGYRVTVEAGDVPVRALDTGGTAAALSLPPGPWAVSVRATGALTTGPATTAALLTAAPVVTGVAFDPAAGAVTLTWQPVPGAAGYAVALLDAGTPVPLTQAPDGTSVTLPASLFAAGGSYVAAVRAVAGPVTGPPAFVPLVTAAPGGVSVGYDGATVRASWQPLPSPEVTGYRVSTLLDGTVTPLGDTTTPDGAWAAAVTDPATTLVVQPLAGWRTGAPSVPVPVLTEALVVGPSYVAPQTGPALAGTEIVLALPELFTTPRQDPVDLPLGLVLAPAAGGGGTYTLTVPATSPLWTFTDRPDVVAAWISLVAQLQQLAVTPYGLAALTEAVARSVPQTFAETLYFAYGLQFARGCFDLRPGIVLRVEYEAYQVPPGAQSQPLSGFVTSAVADYDVASYAPAGVWTSGLDAFLAALAQQGVRVPDAGSPPGAGQLYGSGGVLDLFGQRLRLPYARVVYPPAFLATTSPGSTAPELNAVLLAADTPGALEDATDNVRNNRPPGAGVAAAYLRGRTVVRPLVRIEVNDVPRLVPVGTTLGNVLASEGRRPPALTLPLDGVTLYRARGAAVTPGVPPAGDWQVVLGWPDTDPAVLDLPLLHGDRLDVSP